MFQRLTKTPTVMEAMSEKIIKTKLKNMSNSTPGKDRVEYRHLRQVDPDCKVLACIFNKCLAQKQIPSGLERIHNNSNI